MKNIRAIRILVSCFLTFLVLLQASPVFSQGKRPLPDFKDLKGDTERFMGYYYNIKLSASEQEILKNSLGAIPAPCCSDHTALTC